MFKFDPSIARIEPSESDYHIAANTSALGEKVAKEIEDKKKKLTPKSTAVFIDLGRFEFDKVKQNVISGLEAVFRGRIWASNFAGTEWIPVAENDECSARYVKLEFKREINKN